MWPFSSKIEGDIYTKHFMDIKATLKDIEQEIVKIREYLRIIGNNDAPAFNQEELVAEYWGKVMGLCKKISRLSSDCGGFSNNALLDFRIWRKKLRTP